jgi:two-component sensor histidine kinase
MRSLRGLLASIPQFAASSISAYAFAVACVAVATLVRLGLGIADAPSIVPYATYYPAVLVATLAGGFAPGLFALVIGGLVADFLFMPASASWANLTTARMVNFFVFGLSASVVIVIALAHRDALKLVERADERRALLIEELRHRMKNTYAVMQVIISQALGRDSPQIGIINRRIAALLASNDHIADATDGLSMMEIFTAEVGAHAPSRVHADGELIMLDPESSRIVALLVHELVTNAVKYGAFSNERGRIDAVWRVADGILKFSWREYGAPPACRSKTGFGTKFLTEILTRAGGSFSREFEPDGIFVEASLPLERPEAR